MDFIIPGIFKNQHQILITRKLFFTAIRYFRWYFPIRQYLPEKKLPWAYIMFAKASIAN